MKNFSRKFVKILKEIWEENIEENLKNWSFCYPGNRLEDLDEKKLKIELSLHGHQCKF